MESTTVTHTTAHGTLTETVQAGPHTDVVVLAPHGGSIEPQTAVQAQQLASCIDCPAWFCRGTTTTDRSAFSEFHTPSHKLTAEQFPTVQQITDTEPSLAVSIHGMKESGVYIGGRITRTLQEELRSVLRQRLPDTVPVEIHNRGSYAGVLRSNIVNRVTASGRHGLQLEQGWDVRHRHTDVCPQAVADVLTTAVTGSTTTGR